MPGRHELRGEVLDPIDLKFKLARDMLTHRVNDEVNPRSPRNLGDGNEVSVPGNQNDLVDDASSGEGRNVEANPHVDARLLYSGKGEVILSRRRFSSLHPLM